MDQPTRQLSQIWDLDRPLSQSEFYSLPKGMCVKYVGGLQDRYNASCPMIADMLKMSSATLSKYMKDLDYNFNKRGSHSNYDLDMWERFCNRKTEPVSFEAIDFDNQLPAYEDVKDMSRKSKEEGLDRFVNECCQLSSDENSIRWMLFCKIYKLWCSDNGQMEMTTRTDNLKGYVLDRYGSEMTFYGCDYPNGPSTTLFIRFDLNKDVIDRYRKDLNSEYTAMLDSHPYVRQINTDIREVSKEMSVKDSNITKEDSHKRFSLSNASGTFTYEGYGEDIFNDLSNRFKGDNIRVKIEWEVINNG